MKRRMINGMPHSTYRSRLKVWTKILVDPNTGEEYYVSPKHCMKKEKKDVK